MQQPLRFGTAAAGAGPQQATPKMSFGQQQATPKMSFGQQQAAPKISFGAAANPAAGGFKLGGMGQQAAAAPKVTFSANQQPQPQQQPQQQQPVQNAPLGQQQQPGLNFGQQQQQQQQPKVSLGQQPQQQPQQQGGLSLNLGGGFPAPKAAGGAAPAAAAGGLNFAAPKAAGATGGGQALRFGAPAAGAAATGVATGAATGAGAAPAGSGLPVGGSQALRFGAPSAAPGAATGAGAGAAPAGSGLPAPKPAGSALFQGAAAPGSSAAAAAPKASAPALQLGAGTAAAATGGSEGAKKPPLLSQSSTILRNKTVGELINGWSDKLEEHVKAFTNAALVIANQDKQLLENGDRIFDLHTQFNRITAAQHELAGSLDVIRTQQDELEQLLDMLEQEIAQAETEHPGGPDPYLSYARPGMQRDADSEREQAYAMAEEVHAELGKMGDTLTDLVGQLNSTAAAMPPQGAEEGSAQQQLSNIVLVLNHHLNTLQWIEQNVFSMQGALADAGREFSELKRQQDRRS